MTELEAPPEARRDATADDFFGTLVPDPYRWLEDSDSELVRDWSRRENDRTTAYLQSLPGRDSFKKRLTELWSYEIRSVPLRHGDRTFYFENDGTHDHPILFVLDGPDDVPRVLLDPNALSPDGSVALATWGISGNGAKLAYALSSGGSKWTEVHVRDVDTARDEPDVLHWTAFPSFAWLPDSSGFYYSRYPEPLSQPTEGQTGAGSVWVHKLGTTQADDTLAFQLDDIPGAIYTVHESDDGRFIFVDVAQGTDRKNGIFVHRLGSEEPFTALFDLGQAAHTIIGNSGSDLFLATDLDAPRGKVIAVDLDRHDSPIRTVVPESSDIVDRLFSREGTPGKIVDGALLLVVTRDAHQEIRVFDLDGTSRGDVALPGPGSITDLSGRPQDTALYFTFESFLYPPSVVSYEPARGRLETVHQPEIAFDVSHYVTEQTFYPSRDGTSIPMFVTHARDLSRDGTNPALLYGYGGFGVGLTPAFSASLLPWLEQGGVYAAANLRGGNEYGEDWHAAGMLGNKQNVFDDFIAAAEHLQRSGYSSTSRLAIRGASNGGLLVASCLVQRPDLYGAVVCEVPVIDMLRYHRFSSGIWWVPEYGNADENPEHFAFLHAYSPLHNVRPDVCYPPTLVATADGDDHVVPAHAMKFVATLQAAQSCANPILLQVRTKIGHGGGKPKWKIVEEESDILAFLADALAIDPPA